MPANSKPRFFLVGNLADDDEEVVRIAGLLRGVESAAQAVSVSSMVLPIFSPEANPVIWSAVWTQ